MDSRSSVALGAVFHATGPTPFHGITTDGRLGHQDGSVHPTSTSGWPFLPWWNSRCSFPSHHIPRQKAESVAKARLWLPPGPAPREGVLGNPARLVSKVRETEVSFRRGKKKAEEQKEIPTAEKPKGQLELGNEPGKQATWEPLPRATAVSPVQSSRAQKCLQGQCQWAGICSKLDLELRLATSE